MKEMLFIFHPNTYYSFSVSTDNLDFILELEFDIIELEIFVMRLVNFALKKRYLYKKLLFVEMMMIRLKLLLLIQNVNAFSTVNADMT